MHVDISQMLHSLVLAVVQGLTEFLPVSSSGHLVLAQHWLGSREGDLFFDVVLHVGTLGSVVTVYRREIRRLLRCDGPALRYLVSVAVGTLPLGVVGMLLRHRIEALFAQPVFAAAGLLLTAAVLFSARFRSGDTAALPEPWEPRPLPPLKALAVGAAQAMALLPGISRSGSTIAASLWLGVPRAEAARFSFLLFIPAICGALVLQLKDGAAAAAGDVPVLVISALAAFGVGLLAIRWTALAVVQAHFWKFSLYCAAVGFVGLLILA